MSYDSTTGKITAPVSIDDVYTALGASSYDLATLCKSASINMYSVHKPTKMKYSFEEEFVDGSDRRKEWWKGAEKDYMIELHKYTVKQYVTSGEDYIGKIADLFDNPSSHAWSLKNIGSDGYTYYRLTDFDGYVGKKKWSAGSVTDAPVNAFTNTTAAYSNGDFVIVFYTAIYSESDVFTNGGLLTFLQCLGVSSFDQICLGALIRLTKSGATTVYMACTVPMKGEANTNIPIYDSNGNYRGAAYHNDYQSNIALRLTNDIFSKYIGYTMDVIPIASAYELVWGGYGSNDVGLEFIPILPPEYPNVLTATVSKHTADEYIDDITLKILFVKGSESTTRTYSYQLDRLTVQASQVDKNAVTVQITDVTMLLFKKTDAGGYAWATKNFTPAKPTSSTTYSYTNSLMALTLTTTVSSQSNMHQWGISSSSSEIPPGANSDGSAAYAGIFVTGEVQTTKDGVKYSRTFNASLYVALSDLTSEQGYTNS